MRVGFFLLAALIALSVRADRIDLSTVRVVVPEGASTNAVRAAAELEFHLGLVAGSRYPSAAGTRFVVGERPAGAPAAKAFESCAQFSGGSLYFWGDEERHGQNETRGPLFAVYEFLDKALGVTWAFPGTNGVVVSSRRELELVEGASWRFSPPFAIAKFRVPAASSYRKYIARPEVPEIFRPSESWWKAWCADIAVWYDRMRIACTNDIASDHSFKDWQGRYLKAHPDWFAYVTNPSIRRSDTNGRGVVDKEAKHVQFCVSNPEVPVAIVADWQARGAPGDLAIGPNDGKYGFCHCEACLRLDTRRPGEQFFDHLTDRYVQFYNRIAELAVKVRPDVRLSTYAYSAYEKPPRRERILHGDSIYFGVVPIFGDDYGGGTGFGRLLDDWHEAGMRHFFVRPNFMWYCPAVPRGIERYLYDHCRTACERGTMGFSYGCWPRPLNAFEYYVLASVLHDPGLGFDWIAERFYSQYGAAAPEARAYFERVRSRSSRLMDAMVRATNRQLDDSALAKNAYLGVTHDDLAGDMPLLRPGLGRKLSSAERRRFMELVIRARHAVLTFDFVATSKGADEEAFQAAARVLHDFRLRHFDELGREGGAWHSVRNCEGALWRRTSFAAHATNDTVSACRGGRTVTSLSGSGWTFDGEPVSVPHTWNVQDGCDGIGREAQTSVLSTSYARRKGTYRRTLPATTPGRRAFLRFGAAASRAEVRVNGQVAGRHAGAFTAFEVEITGLLRAGDNVLEVTVDNELDAQREQQPISADFTVYGGLYRDVSLVETDAASFDTVTDGGPGVWVRPDATTGVVEVGTRLRGASSQVRLSFEIRERGGRCVVTSDTPRLTVPYPRLWSPESPVLYTLVARLTDGTSRDEVSVDFGFRRIEIKDDGFYLNGKRRKLRGVNRHQDREGKGWAISAADEQEDVAWIKRMGADAVRTAHYPQSGTFYDLCDREGLLAWVEYPNVDAVNGSAAYAERAAAGVREMIVQNRNHPSVFVWSLANEIDAKFMAEQGLGAVRPEQVIAPLAAQAKALDPTRPTALVTCDRSRAAVNATTDQLGVNLYPGWYRDSSDRMSETVSRMLDVNPGRRTVAVTEYGAGGCVWQHGEPSWRCQPLSSVHTEEYQAYVHHGNYRDLLADDRVWGSFVWVMFDFGADARREGPRHGLNDKGLMTFDHRTPKDAFFLYKANWNPEPELHLVGSRLTETTNEAVTVMAFSNGGGVRLTVNGRDFGIREPDAVKTAVWEGVPLTIGTNAVRITCADRSVTAVWKRGGCSSGGLRPETAKWQAAIDEMAAKGGGRVVVPAGVHPVGQLDLRSNVELYLERGAVLEGLPGIENYRVVTLPCSEGTWSAVVSGFGVTNVAISGEGEINGRGERFSMDYRNVPKTFLTEGLRPRGVFFADSHGIRLSDFTLRDAGCWGIVFKCCDGVVARRVTVDSHAHHNNDGFDIEAKNVLIEDCDVDCGDDGICIKSNTPDFRVENITVRRCAVRSHCNAMKLGTASHGMMRNIRFENCVAEAPRRNFMDRTPGREGRPAYDRAGFEWLPNGVGCSAICVECVDGGTVEGVTYDGIEVSGFQVPIFVRGGARRNRMCGIPPGNRHILRNVVIRNVRGRAEGRVPSSISGVAGCVPKNIVLENVAIDCRGEGAEPLPTALPGPEYDGAYPEATMFRTIRLPAYGLFVDKAENVRLDNVRFTLAEGQSDFRQPVCFSSKQELLP